MPDRSTPWRYVSRSGEKLAAALATFEIDPAGWTCVDLGSHTGGFVDCLLQHGAARVYAVDPGAGVLAKQLRDDPRVHVCERTNALNYVTPEPCQLATIDVGWTPQRLILPAAQRCLTREGLLISLIKPQYEAPKSQLRGGVLPDDALPETLTLCRDDAADLMLEIVAELESPLRGHGGNREFLWLLRSAG